MESAYIFWYTSKTRLNTVTKIEVLIFMAPKGDIVTKLHLLSHLTHAVICVAIVATEHSNKRGSKNVIVAFIGVVTLLVTTVQSRSAYPFVDEKVHN